MSKEAEINGKRVGEESLITIKLNIKNLIILISFILSFITTGYYLLKEDINQINNKIENNNKEIKKEIDQIRDEDLKIIYNQVNRIDGKVQVLVNAMGNNPMPNPTNDLPDIQ